MKDKPNESISVFDKTQCEFVVMLINQLNIAREQHPFISITSSLLNDGIRIRFEGNTITSKYITTNDFDLEGDVKYYASVLDEIQKTILKINEILE